MPAFSVLGYISRKLEISLVPVVLSPLRGLGPQRRRADCLHHHQRPALAELLSGRGAAGFRRGREPRHQQPADRGARAVAPDPGGDCGRGRAVGIRLRAPRRPVARPGELWLTRIPRPPVTARERSSSRTCASPCRHGRWRSGCGRRHNRPRRQPAGRAPARCRQFRAKTALPSPAWSRAAWSARPHSHDGRSRVTSDKGAHRERCARLALGSQATAGVGLGRPTDAAASFGCAVATFVAGGAGGAVSAVTHNGVPSAKSHGLATRVATSAARAKGGISRLGA